MDYIEADIHPLSGGDPVCRHERRPGGLPILLEKWYIKFEFQTLSLEEVARTAQEKNTGVYADLKNGRTQFVRDVLHILERTGALRDAVISGHFWDSLIEAGRSAPVQVFLSIPDKKMLDRFWPYLERASGPIHGVAVRDRVLTEDVFTRFRAKGLRVFPWTVDDPQRIDQMVSMRVDGVISNDVSQLRRLQDELGAGTTN